MTCSLWVQILFPGAISKPAKHLCVSRDEGVFSVDVALHTFLGAGHSVSPAGWTGTVSGPSARVRNWWRDVPLLSLVLALPRKSSVRLGILLTKTDSKQKIQIRTE